MNEIIMIIFEKVLEAIYFSIFMIKGKNIKEKRILFICLMIFQYLVLKYFIKFNVGFQLAYIFMTYLDLKVLYKDKAQITDVFLFMFASIILIFISFISYLLVYYICEKNVTYNWYMFAILLNRIILFGFLYFTKSKINKLYQIFYSYWNRPNKLQNIKIRSLTLRNISIIIFNLMFYIINLGMAFAIAVLQ